MTSTDAIASEADDQVEPQSRANCTIDFVSSSMNPAPRRKKCQFEPRAVLSNAGINALPLSDLGFTSAEVGLKPSEVGLPPPRSESGTRDITGGPSKRVVETGCAS